MLIKSALNTFGSAQELCFQKPLGFHYIDNAILMARSPARLVVGDRLGLDDLFVITHAYGKLPGQVVAADAVRGANMQYPSKMIIT